MIHVVHLQSHSVSQCNEEDKMLINNILYVNLISLI